MARIAADYLFKRKSSQFWWYRFVYPREMGLPEVRVSTGETDRYRASLKAGPAIHNLKMEVHLWKAALKAKELGLTPAQFQALFVEKPGVTPGNVKTNVDGSLEIATDTSITTIKDGVAVSVEPNTRVLRGVVSDMVDLLGMGAKDFVSTLVSERDRKTEVDGETIDEEIINGWVKDRVVSPKIVSEARNTLADLKAITGKRTIIQMVRADAKKLYEHYADKGIKPGTVEKKIGFLRSAWNVALRDGRVSKANPFSSIVSAKAIESRSEDRLSMSEEDIALLDAHLHEMDADERLLWQMMRFTGMRNSEAFTIQSEFKSGSIRYVTIGIAPGSKIKTRGSKRNIPLPAGLIPYLPDVIAGPLFTDMNCVNVSKNLNRWFRKHITDPQKVPYSLRHRAKDRMREARVDEAIQDAILGHAKPSKEVSRGYGSGYSIAALKEAIDKIG